MKLKDCHNFEDFRKLAKKKLPSPIFHYIDGGADDEVTLNRNTSSFNDYDLVPSVLNDVSNTEIGFNSEYNAVSIIYDNKVEKIEKNLKSYIANKIARKIINNFIQ